MNEALPSLHAPMRASPSRSALLLILFAPQILTIRCYLHHEIWEDGHKLEILPDICSSNRYCVSAIYRDPDPVKKNGYSRGCDRVDCDESDEKNSVWRDAPDGMRCRSHRDYGRQGQICCCKTDLCNSGNFASLTLLLFSLLFV
ncbi:unnamed protein product [Strongylus vulgaris]|uniref:Activin types I and II receptor domain-containing protein n=1 Tax=Strongylus vulgaris TaxID=40348 RepID=A0A3P7JNV4_STRVU|nr:unnamed protein product [Strongylus vulgaris]